MDDLMEKLQAVLSDEESMNQIKQLAGMLGAGDDDGGDAPDFSSLFGSMMGGNDTTSGAKNASESGEKSESPFDIGKIMQLLSLASTATAKDKNTELLLALKPHLSEEKQPKIDKAVKLLKLLAIWSVVKESGVLDNLDIL